eukprot:162979-Prymnesium_polylepis.1
MPLSRQHAERTETGCVFEQHPPEEFELGPFYIQLQRHKIGCCEDLPKERGPVDSSDGHLSLPRPRRRSEEGAAQPDLARGCCLPVVKVKGRVLVAEPERGLQEELHPRAAGQGALLQRCEGRREVGICLEAVVAGCVVAAAQAAPNASHGLLRSFRGQAVVGRK